MPVPLTRGYEHDLDAMLAAITPATVAVLLCTPNNPTGPALRQTEVESFVDRVPDDVAVVLDEAYVEFVDDPAAVDGLTLLDRPNVVVLRTFSKAYGLAGLRIGYCVGPAELASVRPGGGQPVRGHRPSPRPRRWRHCRPRRSCGAGGRAGRAPRRRC